MDEPRFHPLDYLSVVRRRRWWFAIPATLAVAVGVALALFLPKEFLSSATVGVTAPAVSPDLARSGRMDHEERVRAISQQLLSRAVLGRVAQSENPGITPGEIDAAIVRLRAKVQPITFPTPVAPDGNPRLDSFIVSYVDGTPEAAQRITNRLVEVFVDETTKVRATRAEGTTAFLDNQVNDAQAKLTAIEERLRDAKQQNIGRLPEQTGANLSTLNGLRQQLESTNIALRGEQDRLSMIDRQLDAMRQGTEGLPLLRGNGESAMAPGMKVQALEQELAAAQMTYTEKHPEVIRLKEELRSARAAAAAERARPPEDRLGYLKNDPTYRQLLADQEMGRMRVRDLQRAETQARGQISLYQQRVETTPMVEQRLASLQREYDLQRAQYADLVAKREAARMAEALDRRQAVEQFRVFSPATWPKEPFRPNRLRILLGSFLLAVFLGGLGVVGREFMDRSVHDAQTLQHEYELPVLGEISTIPVTLAEGGRAHRRTA